MNMSHVYKRRLLKLAEFLENLPRSRFDYGTWAKGQKKGSECGTTACALGWACSMPSFRRLGLRLEWDGMGARPRDKETGDVGSDAAARVFGLTLGEAEYLFHPATMPPCGWYLTRLAGKGLKHSPDYDATSKQVAKHIRAFVAAKYPDMRSKAFPVPSLLGRRHRA